MPDSHRILIAVSLAVFVLVAVMSARTHRPQIDEGMFASPAYNLAVNGHFGTTVLEREKSPLTRIEERTYWVMPMFLLASSAAFKTLGFSIVSMRLVSVAFGLVLLWAVYFIAFKVSRDPTTALIALVIAACDYMVLETASSARMDMMSAALGFAAIAVYLVFRERNLALAVVLSHSILVIAGLTHPNAIMALIGLVFLTVYLDYRSLSLRMMMLAALPYLVGGSAFGLWVLQDPQAFKDQFIDNAMMGGRMSGISSPLANLAREFTERYPHAYGLGENSGGHSGPIYLKSLMLIGYAAGVIGVLVIGELRRNRMLVAMLALFAIYFVILALIDGQKQTTYLIHIVPLYIVFMASVIGWFWRSGRLPKLVLVGAVLAIIALPLGGMALKIRQDTRGRFFNPMIEFLQATMTPEDYVMASADTAFGLGFEANLIADGRFGFYTGKRPRFIVHDSAVEQSWTSSKTHFPAFYEYFPRLLKEEYRVAFENSAYTIYERQ